MVPRGGIEPPTRDFQSPALPTELSRQRRCVVHYADFFGLRQIQFSKI